LIFVIGGTEDDTYDIKEISLVEYYNFSTRIWSVLPSINYPRANSLSMMIDDYLYTMSGFNFTNWYTMNTTFERHKLGTDYWEVFTLTNDLTQVFQRSSSTPFLFKGNQDFGDQIFVYGGWKPSDGYIKDVNIIDKSYFLK
jgi:hypothetical protein